MGMGLWGNSVLGHSLLGTRLHENLLAELNAAEALDWSRAVIDGLHLRAMKGGPKPDRARSTVPDQVRNTISSPKGTESHCRCR